MLKPKGLSKYFLPQKDPKELVRKWQGVIRQETRQIERQLRGSSEILALDISREKKKVETSIKEAAKRGDMASAKILAKEIVQTNRTVTQLHANRAHMMAMQTALTEQLAIARVSGTLEKSTQVMETVGKVLKIPELMQITQNLAKEMEKAGVIEEMVADTMDIAMDSEDLEEEIENEVNKVLTEITGEIKELPTPSRPQPIVASQAVVAEEDEAIEDIDDEALQARLNAVRN